ncbi:hypothetical protein HGI47_21455 [Novosphingobium sp. ERN07]|uniref:hypothetical protein n=1 Tax=Novosphingobium sp. ERN07 TaxID=2726187 RepID=UPI001457400F|nr:hypothetical protein [Novosphingobium sp. ERN07]NLR73433.1 hypothetical protein [Novosphingobium sp. ERN07]
MGRVLHGSAKTTHVLRGELQRSQASVAHLAKRYGINEKTVLTWRKRQSVEDLPMGPKERRSTVLSLMEEAAIVALREQARLPLDDVYIALKDVIPHLMHSSLHRCLQRHVRDWLIAYNLAKQLKALWFKTQYEAIEELWKSKPDIFIVKPHHHMLGLNNKSASMSPPLWMARA